MARQPTARVWHAAVGVGGKVFVWAGYNNSTTIQTTTVESFNVSALTWEQPRQLNGSLPDGLQKAAVTGDGENFYFFGGCTRSGCINTLYEINPCTLLCRELLPRGPSDSPSKQEGSGCVYFKNKLVVYGGYTSKEQYTDDVHIFDLDKSEYKLDSYVHTEGQVHKSLFRACILSSYTKLTLS